jgi:uncharacterized membrane protein YqiK
MDDLRAAIAEVESLIESTATGAGEQAAEIKAKAEAWQATYDDLNKVDDQFDLSDATMSVGIALSGVAALVNALALASTDEDDGSGSNLDDWKVRVF